MFLTSGGRSIRRKSDCEVGVCVVLAVQEHITARCQYLRFCIASGETKELENACDKEQSHVESRFGFTGLGACPTRKDGPRDPGVEPTVRAISNGGLRNDAKVQ